MILGNATRGKLVASSIVAAPAGLARLLILRRLSETPSRAVRFAGPAFWAAFAPRPVDVVFLDASSRVVALASPLAPWRSAGPFAGAVEAIVLEEGSCGRVPIQVGDRLEWTPTTGERIAAGARPPDLP